MWRSGYWLSPEQKKQMKPTIVAWLEKSSATFAAYALRGDPELLSTTKRKKALPLQSEKKRKKARSTAVNHQPRHSLLSCSSTSSSTSSSGSGKGEGEHETIESAVDLKYLTCPLSFTSNFVSEHKCLVSFVKARMQEYACSQKAIADSIDVSEAQMSRWMRLADLGQGGAFGNHHRVQGAVKNWMHNQTTGERAD